VADVFADVSQMASDMTLANVSPPSLRRSDRSIKNFTCTAMTRGRPSLNSRFRDLTLGRNSRSDDGGFFDSRMPGEPRAIMNREICTRDFFSRGFRSGVSQAITCTQAQQGPPTKPSQLPAELPQLP